MTAAGFAMFAVGWMLAIVTNGKSVTAGLLVIGGSALLVAGISTFLWRMMP